MGRMQRNKGKRFERDIAARLRVLWPDAEIRRSSQAERAYEADVFATGSPTLERLWLELQDAKAPTPLKKLAQAERDLAAGGPHVQTDRFPVVVWHRIRELTVHVTTRMWVIDCLRGISGVTRSGADDVVVQLELGGFLGIVAGSSRGVGWSTRATQRHKDQVVAQSTAGSPESSP
jgi:hypothetical protein